MKKIGNFPDLLSDLLGKIFPFRAGSFQTQPDTRMRAGGWLVLAVLAGAAVAVPQEVSPLGSAVAGDLETRARWVQDYRGPNLQLLSSDLILHLHFLFTKIANILFSNFISKAEQQLQAASVTSTFDAWNYESNITEETKLINQRSTEAFSKLTKQLGKEAQMFALDQIQDYDVRRKLKLMKNIGTAALPDNKLTQFINLTTSMSEIYRLIIIVFSYWILN